jgi:iron(III) transport system ATP-binding protein
MTDVRMAGITAGYGAAPVLDDLALDIRSGEFLAVLGASGSGKTTLLRVLAGFLRPLRGEVWLGERCVAGPGEFVPPERRRVGIVPQEGALFPHLDVAENVGFGLPRGSGARIAQMLDLVGLPGLGHARPHELSGGQQQRVALARAVAPAPDLLCLDEPFSALDASLRAQVRGEVRDVLRAVGTTTVLVTHDQEEALAMADRVAVVRAGRIVQVAAPDALYRAPVDLGVARFVGEVVELPARVSAPGRVTCVLGEVPLRTLADGAGPVPRTEGILALRPEDLALRPPGTSGATGTVTSASYHGHDTVVEVQLDEGPRLAVRHPGEGAAAAGSRVDVVAIAPGAWFPGDGPAA